VGLADSYNMLGWWEFVPPQEAAPKAKQAALKALELDPFLPEAHASLALVKSDYDWDWKGAEEEFKEAFRLNPNYETAYRWYGGHLAATGRHDQAIAAAKRAQQLDPTSVLNSSDVGWELYLARRYDEAVAQLQRTVDMDSNYFPAHNWLALAYLGKSIYQQATEEAQKSAILSNNNTDAMTALAVSHAVSGNTRAATSILRELQAASGSRYVSSWDMAAVFTSLHNSEEAFKSLQKAYEDHDYRLPLLSSDNRFELLHSDPRYADLLRRMGLPQ
jgi:tetratricopeptide (TPR) repeat protein